MEFFILSADTFVVIGKLTCKKFYKAFKLGPEDGVKAQEYLCFKLSCYFISNLFWLFTSYYYFLFSTICGVEDRDFDLKVNSIYLMPAECTFRLFTS